MIELKHISKVFPTADGEFTALNDVNITIEDGDVFGIVGMSGAGKSTLVRCINLLERPTSGQVVIDGKDLCAMNSKELIRQRRSISMIFQQFNLLMQRTCLKNICFPMEIAGVQTGGCGKARSGSCWRSSACPTKRTPTGSALRRPEAAHRHCPRSGV